MTKLFLELLNLSITASILILIILVLRFLLQKAPKWIICLFYVVIALRLMVPIHLESSLSLNPKSTPIQLEPQVTAPASMPVSHEGNDLDVTHIMHQTSVPVQPARSPKARIMDVASYVWLCGLLILLGYAMTSYFLIHQKVAASIRQDRQVYHCDDIESPFILGVFRPRIYLPTHLDETTKANVLSHEYAHLKRRDYLWKPLGFLLLSIYWFNPLCWIAYLLFCQDIELACDEKATKQYTSAQRAAYCQALLNLSVNRRQITACPVAFGETNVKGRIQSVLHYQKPRFWILLLAIIACIIVSICFLTDPKKESAAKNHETKSGVYNMDRAFTLSNNPLSSDMTIGGNTTALAEKDNNTLESTQELSFEVFDSLYHSDSWTEITSGDISYWEQYPNYISMEGLYEDSLTDYGLIDFLIGDMPFELQIYYWTQKGPDYGHFEQEIDSIILYNKTTDDGLLLYACDQMIAPYDLQAFTQKTYDITQKLSFPAITCQKLSGPISFGPYQMESFEQFHGYHFFCDSFEEMEHAEGTPEEWLSLGGMGECTEDLYDVFGFENGKAVWYHPWSNHCTFEPLEQWNTDDFQVLFYQADFDLYTAANYVEGKEPTSKYWVAFFVSSEEAPAYVAYFDQRYFTKEEVTSFANQVKNL